MMFETIDQAGVFLAMAYAGMLIGFVYDGLRFLRQMLAAGALVTAFLDLLFWLGAGAVAAVALALRGEESMRLYALGGCACGVVLYLLGISRVLRAAGQALARAYRRVEDSPKWQARLKKQREHQEKQREHQEARRAEKQLAQNARRQENAAKKRGANKRNPSAT